MAPFFILIAFVLCRREQFQFSSSYFLVLIVYIRRCLRKSHKKWFKTIDWHWNKEPQFFSKKCIHCLPYTKSSQLCSLTGKPASSWTLLQIKQVHFMHETFNSPSYSKWIKMKVMKRYSKVFGILWKSAFKTASYFFAASQMHDASAKKYEFCYCW